MGQVAMPVKGEIYIAKIKEGGRVWIFESDYKESKGVYTEASVAYCYDCNGEEWFRDTVIPHHCNIVRDNGKLQWMRLVSENEKRLFYLKTMKRYYE